MYLENALLGTTLSCEQIAHALQPSLSEDNPAQFDQLVESIYAEINTPDNVLSLLEKGILPPSKTTPLPDPHQSLTQQQLDFLSAVTNPFTAATLPSLCKLHGVTMDQHNTWMTHPNYVRAYNRLLKSRLPNARGEVSRRVAQKATTGDAKSVELYFRLMGEPLPELTSNQTTTQLENLLAVLQRVLTVEQMHEVAMELRKPQLRELVQTEPTETGEL